MPQTGEQQLEALQKDIACPSCEYNLRGLYGDVVNCPECGEQCNVAELLSRRWEGPWRKAPGFKRLLIPAAWAVVCLVAIGVIAGVYHDQGKPAKLVLYVILSAIFVWLWLSIYVWRFEKRWQTVILILLLHVVLFGYLVGFYGVACSIAFTCMFILDSEGYFVFIPLACLIGFSLLLWGCRCVERFVARQCIRRYLNKQPPS